jgi:hypothetical protein
MERGFRRENVLPLANRRRVRELQSTILVRAPSSFALAFLNTYVQDLAHGAENAVLPLRFPLKEVAGLVLEREVTVHVSYELREPGQPPYLRVHWQAADSDLFPHFDGTVEAQTVQPRTCRLTVAGTYNVPLGLVGILFDAVLGARIAQSTLDGLLDEFRKAIESDYDKRIGLTPD